MCCVVQTVHKSKHQFSSSSKDATLISKSFLMGVIMRGHQVNDRHIKEFISHVHKKRIGTKLKQNNVRGHKTFLFIPFIFIRNPFNVHVFFIFTSTVQLHFQQQRLCLSARTPPNPRSSHGSANTQKQANPKCNFYRVASHGESSCLFLCFLMPSQ